jgi:class 3 adenylate cyclase
MEGALARHDAIMRQTIDAYGGHVFKTVGDAIYAAFTTAVDALDAALAAQRAIAAEWWATTLLEESLAPEPIGG